MLSSFFAVTENKFTFILSDEEQMLSVSSAGGGGLHAAAIAKAGWPEVEVPTTCFVHLRLSQALRCTCEIHLRRRRIALSLSNYCNSNNRSTRIHACPAELQKISV
jgi:hypothetical protein